MTKAQEFARKRAADTGASCATRKTKAQGRFTALHAVMAAE